MGRSASEIFGYHDDLKLRSSMTLFASVSEPGSVFHRVLEQYFGGEMDQKTLDMLEQQTSGRPGCGLQSITAAGSGTA